MNPIQQLMASAGNQPVYRTAPCPLCGVKHEFEVCTILPKIIPACDECDAVRNKRIEEERMQDNWSRTLNERMPASYRAADPQQAVIWYTDALAWTPDGESSGGVGLIGESGQGKSFTLSCLIQTLRIPFLWWSGTEARDAHLESLTADRDREGARRRWEHAMNVPILVLDDISQGKMTASWSSGLFDLLETRSGSNMPTLWSSQLDLTRLRERIYQQNDHELAQADAISRRLALRSLIIQG